MSLQKTFLLVRSTSLSTSDIAFGFCLVKVNFYGSTSFAGYGVRALPGSTLSLQIVNLNRFERVWNVETENFRIEIKFGI